eukprot:CAMPEP_0185255012 /NCGR_PEP_ID=MMETSP1359-20130426/3983_1 /TAXON_ID=552665 /ORGANISM="Bigelowiella longifila, Strain CCMP242" /LENGTH=334 /DNA_ID=CAMNT_0027838577 /DNA_START=45 /DNA_END=1049 /DNA_ORIENTATION=+
MAFFAANELALCCVLFSMLVTMCQIRAQLIWNSNLAMRKHVIRILMMVPLYAFQCYLGLSLKDSSVFFDTLRECYEAVVIYSFLGLIIGYLGGERHVVYVMENKPSEYVHHPHLLSICLGSKSKLGDEFYMFTKLGTLQYVIVKPVTALLTFALDAINMYGENGNPFRLDRGYIYVVAINTISQALAIYCLLHFYHVMSKELEPLDFIPKALMLKAVIFFTYWQAIGIRLLYSVELFPSTLFNMSRESDLGRFIDLILCVEMSGFAVGQWFAWGTGNEFFNPEESVSRPYGASMLSAANLGDLWEDTKNAVENGEVERLLGGSQEEPSVDLCEL